MKIFVLTALDEAARASLRQQLPAEAEVIFREEPAAEQPPADFLAAEVLLGNPPPAWLTAGPLPKLRFWQIDSAGFDRYKGVRLSVPVANMGDFFAWACAETMVAGLLALYRRLPELVLLQEKQQWVGAEVRGRQGLLRGKRVAILGAGTIGQAVREQLSGFGCAVQLLARTDPQAQLHSKEELAAALPETDVVVNCLPGSADNFFSAELIAAMRPGSIYASVGRGNTTDEPALIEALRAGRLGGAVLDVTATEPIPPGHPLWTLPNVLLTQHTGGGQPREAEGKIDQLVRNLGHLRAGQPLENLVDLGAGY
ncbi:D-2-hydroxyacid dehydrogenase [Hymenobacter sp. BT559]|uniref:D-2-hydroxyacid dehydrogenase n=1 Tax=Hymenobacter sp. BT559 TaxID=2795729 RepID=UPI0018EB2BCB|nr:D-2-hydroxyacid dehydrogenase [Hymenobacter sp. BT559]MBJ6142643.1 D-2-hydroxyacid dehydrogenase [Hymenobacter sp. BT559]